jgi:hypothetical protein
MYGRNALDTGCSINVEIRSGKALALFVNTWDEMCVQFGKVNSGLTKTICTEHHYYLLIWEELSTMNMKISAAAAHKSPFEQIKHTDPNTGVELWLSRDLSQVWATEIIAILR